MSKFDLIEHTAMKFAATYYEAARSQGLKPRNPKHKTPRLWALHNFEKFIPKSLDTLLDMMNNENTPEYTKQKIYDAVMERANDPTVNEVFGNKQLLPELDLKKMLENAPAKPLIVSGDVFTPKPKPVKSKLLNGVSHG